MRVALHHLGKVIGGAGEWERVFLGEGFGGGGGVEGLAVEGEFAVEIVGDVDGVWVGIGCCKGFGPGEGGGERDGFADAGERVLWTQLDVRLTAG